MPADQRRSQLEGRFTRTLNKVLVKLKVEDVPHIKRIIVTVVGGTVLIFGVIFIVTPFPAVLIMPLGLAILGTEYAWARRWLRKARMMAKQALSRTQKIMGTGGSSSSKAAAAREKAAKAMPATERNDEGSEEMAGATGGSATDKSVNSH